MADTATHGLPAAPPKAPSAPSAEEVPRKAVCTVCCGTVTLRLTLSSKFLSRPFANAVIAPFLNAYNKKAGASLTVTDVAVVKVDDVLLLDLHALSSDVLTHATHRVELIVSSENNPTARQGDDAQATQSASGGSTADPVERVLAAAHEFEVLELPVAPTSASAIRKAYRRVSLAVHPDKVRSYMRSRRRPEPSCSRAGSAPVP